MTNICRQISTFVIFASLSVLSFGVNLTAFCDNDPLNRVDTLGGNSLGWGEALAESSVAQSGDPKDLLQFVTTPIPDEERAPFMLLIPMTDQQWREEQAQKEWWQGLSLREKFLQYVPAGYPLSQASKKFVYGEPAGEVGKELITAGLEVGMFALMGRMAPVGPKGGGAGFGGTRTMGMGGRGMEGSVRGGFGLLGGGTIERGVAVGIGDDVAKMALREVGSGAFRRKLAFQNAFGRLRGGRAVSVQEITEQLMTNTKFRQVSSIAKSQVGMMRNGQFALRLGRGSGYFSRITVHHEFLHMAQYIRNPELNAAVRSWGRSFGGGNIGAAYSFVRRQPYEVLPAAIGSPAIHGTALGGLFGGTYTVYSLISQCF